VRVALALGVAQCLALTPPDTYATPVQLQCVDGGATIDCMGKAAALALLVGCGATNPCDFTQCPAQSTCTPNGSFGECSKVPAVVTQPTKDAGAVVVGPVDAGSGGGGGSMTPADPMVFVTLKYDVATCCEGMFCTCRDCRVDACALTQSVKKSDFDASRLAAYAGCGVSQTAADGYTVTCSSCTRTDRVCRVNGQNYADHDVSCSGPKSRATFCAWFD
jgi:hypothetical protein